MKYSLLSRMFFPRPTGHFRPLGLNRRGGFFCLLALLVLLSACSGDAPVGKGASVAPVQVAKATQRDVPLTITAVGNVASSNSVAVTARVMGELMDVHFREGQDVQEGQLLFSIDKRPFEAVLREAEARLARDRAQLQKARDDLKRFERLVAGGFTSREQYEQSQTDAATLQATVKADEATVESAALQVAYCSISAPGTGRVGAALIDKGNIIKANDDTRPLVTIEAMEPVYLWFAVPETHLPAILKNQAGQQLPVTATPQGGSSVQGGLTLIDNTVDARTGTIRLRATFANTDRSLWPGQFAAIQLGLGTLKDAIVVPLRSVLNGPDGSYVYSVDAENKARIKPVKVGPEFENLLVIEKGLEAGETVVTEGQVRLMPGAPVQVHE